MYLYPHIYMLYVILAKTNMTISILDTHSVIYPFLPFLCIISLPRPKLNPTLILSVFLCISPVTFILLSWALSPPIISFYFHGLCGYSSFYLVAKDWEIGITVEREVQYMSFWGWIVSLSIIHSSFTCLSRKFMISFLYTAEWYSIVCM